MDLWVKKTWKKQQEEKTNDNNTNTNTNTNNNNNNTPSSPPPNKKKGGKKAKQPDSEGPYEHLHRFFVCNPKSKDVSIDIV